MPTLLKDWLANHVAYEAAGRKLAIIAGPGGNAGVFASGMTAAMGKANAFLPNARYIGISVGAYNWVYMLGKNYEASTVFGRFYCDNRFINPWRLLGKTPVLNLDYVLHDVCETGVPINYAATRQSPFTVEALTTGIDCQPHLLALNGMDKHAIQHALRATAAMPLLGRTHDLHHLDNWDGWLVEHHLLSHLQKHGITDVIWLLNRPLVEKGTFTGTILWQHIQNKAHKANPRLAAQIKERLNAGDFLAHPPEGIQLEVFQPHIPLPANCRNPAQLFHALGTSYRSMGEYLGHPDLPYPAEWVPYIHHMPK